MQRAAIMQAIKQRLEAIISGDKMRAAMVKAPMIAAAGCEPATDTAAFVK
jgi:hypothetical protein